MSPDEASAAPVRLPVRCSERMRSAAARRLTLAITSADAVDRMSRAAAVAKALPALP